MSTLETLASFVCDTSDASFPSDVKRAGTRSFLNFVGCAFGGADEEAVAIAAALADALSGPRTCTLIGHRERIDPLGATAINCQSATAMAFDDSYLAAIVHPTCTVGAAALALAETRPVSGAELLTAVILGIELECRLAAALAAPPAEGAFAWYLTGVVGGVGTAATAARLLRLDARQTMHALAIAAVRSGGLRQALPNMCVSYVPGEAARAGLAAAMLAERGMTGSAEAFEGAGGFAEAFSRKANTGAATSGLGVGWECLDNTFKPYPCGLVSHPVIDACLALAHRHDIDPAAIRDIDVHVSPNSYRLGNRPAPSGPHDARVSIQYWASVALLRRAAGLAEIAGPLVQDAALAALRAKVSLQPDVGLAEDAARVAVRMRDGTVHAADIEHCTGSRHNPMNDARLEEKFLGQVVPALGADRATDLASLCWKIADLSDAGAIASRLRSDG